MPQSEKIPAISCKQWLPEWDSFPYSEENLRRKPPSELLLFSMSARQLRKLSGVFVRQRNAGDATGIQRLHEKERSEKISQFVRNGYPFGDLSARQQADVANHQLKKPGWLPTAIVINFLTADDIRRGQAVEADDVIHVSEQDGHIDITLPVGSSDTEWRPHALAPIEVIDGQHRLFAFGDDSELPDDFELPVVAFKGLDVGWQAYLFWSINVSPKKINPSHAYDLFPLLRTQDWLESASAVHVYREARAQELTDLMFRHQLSPWKGRINMLGERRSGWVSQAGWVQAIYNSFLSPGLVGRSRKGLFSANLALTKAPLDWTRPQQAAFLIHLWTCLEEAVRASTLDWCTALRSGATEPLPDVAEPLDWAFAGTKTLLNQEQGVRGFLLALNDVSFKVATALDLDSWRIDDLDAGDTRDEDIERCLSDLRLLAFATVLGAAAARLVEFDWRSFDAPGLDDMQKLVKGSYRGTGGYNRVRRELLVLLQDCDGAVGVAARELVAAGEAAA